MPPPLPDLGGRPAETGGRPARIGGLPLGEGGDFRGQAQKLRRPLGQPVHPGGLLLSSLRSVSNDQGCPFQHVAHQPGDGGGIRNLIQKGRSENFVPPAREAGKRIRAVGHGHFVQRIHLLDKGDQGGLVLQVVAELGHRGGDMLDLPSHLLGDLVALAHILPFRRKGSECATGAGSPPAPVRHRRRFEV